MKTERKPARCVCGRKVEVQEGDRVVKDEACYWVECFPRGKRCFAGPMRKTRAGAIAAWDRVMSKNTKQLERLREQCRVLRAKIAILQANVDWMRAR